MQIIRLEDPSEATGDIGSGFRYWLKAKDWETARYRTVYGDNGNIYVADDDGSGYIINKWVSASKWHEQRVEGVKEGDEIAAVLVELVDGSIGLPEDFREMCASIEKES